jgi:hypothetical protein
VLRQSTTPGAKKSEQQDLQDVQRMAEYVNEPPRMAEGIFHSLLTSDSLDYICRLLYFPGGPRRYHGTQKKAIESPSFRYEQNNLCFLHTDAVFFKTINMVGGRPTPSEVHEPQLRLREATSFSTCL